MRGTISIETERPEEVMELLQDARTEHPGVSFETEGGDGLFPTGVEPELLREIVIQGGPAAVYYSWKFVSSRLSEDESMHFTHENVDEAAWELLESQGGVPKEEATLVDRTKNGDWEFVFEENDSDVQHVFKLHENSPNYEYTEE